MTPEEILRVEKDIVLTLKNVYDPEIPVNIYDLGLISSTYIKTYAKFKG